MPRLTQAQNNICYMTLEDIIDATPPEYLLPWLQSILLDRRDDLEAWGEKLASAAANQRAHKQMHEYGSMEIAEMTYGS